MTAKKYAKSLRLLADWYEKQPPEIPTPHDVINVALYTHLNTNNHKSQVIQVANTLGQCEKSYQYSTFTLSRQFGEITLQFNWNREAVCERKVVGFKEVPAYSVPAHQEEMVEWKCSSILEGKE